MSLRNFLNSMLPLNPPDFMEYMKQRREQNRKDPHQIWVVRNDLKPVDLFCYLWARFGRSNGIQSLLRSDSSDNLIHWEWTLVSGEVVVSFQEHNFRTEIHLMGLTPFTEEDKDRFVRLVKSDFKEYGPAMSQIRNQLEHWDEFLNPYFRIKTSIERMKDHLDSLQLEPSTDRIPDFDPNQDSETQLSAFREASKNYHFGLGLCFGLRTMLPMRAEAFLNLLTFALLKKDIKNDDRLRENHFRQPIDVRLRSLAVNCNGIKNLDQKKLDEFYSLMMERNDTVHGNVSVEKLKFNDVYFMGKVPIFEKYMPMWEKMHGVMLKGVGFESIGDDISTVENFESYLLECVDDDMKPALEQIMQSRDLGIEKKSKRLGCLFSEAIVDFLPSSNPAGGT